MSEPIEILKDGELVDAPAFHVCSTRRRPNDIETTCADCNRPIFYVDSREAMPKLCMLCAFPRLEKAQFMTSEYGAALMAVFGVSTKEQLFDKIKEAIAAGRI